MVRRAGPPLSLACNRYDHFSSRVSFFQVTESVGDLIQLVTPVDDRRYLSSRHELAQDGQILLVQLGK